MGQLGFFDLIRRYESLDEKSDPLVAIAAMLPFESFRSKLKAALIKGELRTSDATRKSLAGRKPWDEIMIFKALVSQALYNLSDDQAEAPACPPGSWYPTAGALSAPSGRR